MCFKLDNGSELFSVQDMHRLRNKASGALGGRTWAKTDPQVEKVKCAGGGSCSCTVKCARCACLEKLSTPEK